MKKWEHHKKNSSHIKVGKEIIAFCDIEIEKQISPLQKSNFLEDLDIDEKLVSNNIFCGEKNYKYFIGD